VTTTFSDNLTTTKSQTDRSIFFQPSETSPTPAGVLSISTGKTWAQYAVVPFPAYGGRGFHMAKLTPGTDKEAESYDVFCDWTDPACDSCECKGWLYHGTCKHRDAACALIENGWL